MPRILHRHLGLRPELTRVNSPPIQHIPVGLPPTDPRRCSHQDGDKSAFVPFLLPGEPKGRVYQCTKCSAIGFRRSRFGGPGKIELYLCSNEACRPKRIAVKRMIGRGPRGAYIWSCSVHATQLVRGMLAP